MTKGRGAQARRQNKRPTRRGSGTMSGRRRPSAMAMAAQTREWRANASFHLRPRITISPRRPSWWRRMVSAIKRTAFNVEASVAPTRASRRIEAQVARMKAINAQGHQDRAVLAHQRRLSGRRR